MKAAVWETAGVTHEGRQRPHNEDAWVARADAGLWMVADGMGGHAAGDIASRLVADAVQALDGQADLPALVDRLDDALTRTNVEIRAYADRHLEGRTMGCTVVSLLAQGDVGVCLWAGDSRLYRLRAGELLQVSRDHDPFQDLVERGALTPEEADARPEASVITRAVGAQPELHLDLMAFDTAPGDVLLLCSDGLYRELSGEEIARHLGAAQSVQEIAQAMLDGALDRGARDNVTVIVIRRLDGRGSP
ncbi:MAG: protein phosphatase 2C domain-containing protein [Pseudomonadales bacterium]|nr:protein phosphatase 2C domain-containing protein [Pseudomonadales bacterium]